MVNLIDLANNCENPRNCLRFFKMLVEFVRTHPTVSKSMMESINRKAMEQNKSILTFTDDEINMDFSNIKIAKYYNLTKEARYRIFFVMIASFINNELQAMEKEHVR